MSGGEPGRYLRTLAIFHEDSQAKMKEITACLEAESLRLYTIYIHALKSASANIGAYELSEAAAILERAGKDDDLSYIKANNAKFLSDLETLLDNINTVISAEATKKQNGSTDIESLKTELTRLKAAMLAFDSAKINEAAKMLEPFAQAADIGFRISRILQNKIIGEYDEAVVVIDMILHGIDEMDA